MDTAIINIKVKPEEKKQAQEAAEALGMPLSVIIKGFLKQFSRTRTITFSAEMEEPNEYMIESLRKSEEDVKAGKVSPTFTNAKDAIAWLDDPNASYANGDKVRDEI